MAVLGEWALPYERGTLVIPKVDVEGVLVGTPLGTRVEFSIFKGLSPNLSDTMYLIISCKKSTPPQNRQLNMFISNSKQ